MQKTLNESGTIFQRITQGTSELQGLGCSNTQKITKIINTLSFQTKAQSKIICLRLI